MFTKPWVMTPRQTQIAAPGDYIRPTMCVPFDKNHLVKEDETPYISSSEGAGEGSGTAAGAAAGNAAGGTSAAAAAEGPHNAGSRNEPNYTTIAGVLKQPRGDK